VSIIIKREPKKEMKVKGVRNLPRKAKKVAPKVAPVDAFLKKCHAIVSPSVIVLTDAMPIEIPAIPDTIDFRYGMVTGAAGSGKTYKVRKILENDPSWGLVTATTGPAARVLGPKVPTINSALHFFNQKSIERNYADGTLRKNIRTLRAKYSRIIIDEASMLPSEMFDCILLACEAEGMGLILVGDFLQLPPVTENNNPPSWIFNSKHWDRFTQNGQNVSRLKTQYRHTNPDFIKGLNHLRAGEGGLALPYLQKAGVVFPAVPTMGNPDAFDGIVITANKDARDNINQKRYDAIQVPESEEIIYNTTRWGKQEKEWSEKDIANTISLKVGCRVMISRNLYEEVNGRKTLTQANGETGVVLSLTASTAEVKRDDGSIVMVAIQNTDNSVLRILENPDRDDGACFTEMLEEATGGVEYMPLALSFACNVHKCQGLTITAPTQMPLWQGRNDDLGVSWRTPAMVYVAASRVRNPEDLRIVGADMMWTGGKSLLDERCKMDMKCKQWV
jgi:ATP-dependent DNA helicase PIF1